jgi:hypothetical protein
MRRRYVLQETTHVDARSMQFCHQVIESITLTIGTHQQLLLKPPPVPPVSSATYRQP